jgi:hypothetical protein
MEVEGELFKLQRSGAPPDQIAPVEAELQQAQEYLQFRKGQK